MPARNALLADLTTPAVYGRAYGFERAMDNLGAIFGPLLALILVSMVGDPDCDLPLGDPRTPGDAGDCVRDRTPTPHPTHGTPVAMNGAGGNEAYLSASDGNVYYYAHLSQFGGARSVSQGEVIGLVGSRETRARLTCTSRSGLAARMGSASIRIRRCSRPVADEQMSLLDAAVHHEVGVQLLVDPQRDQRGTQRDGDDSAKKRRGVCRLGEVAARRHRREHQR